VQKRSEAMTKGPGEIMGVRTKNQRFSLSDESDTAVAPDTFWFYALADIDVGGGRIPVKARKWTQIKGWTEASAIKSIASQKGIQCIHTTEPPPRDDR